VLVGKHADNGFVSASLHLFRKESKLLNRCGLGGSNLNRLM
jgi:hypothetical protein